MKLSALIDQYLAASPEIRGTQRSTLLRMAKEPIGKHTLPLTAKNVIDHMKERNLTVQPATANIDLVYLRGMLDYAKHGLGIDGVTTAPVDDAMPILTRQRLIGTSETRTRIPTPDEHAAIVAHIRKRDPVMADLIDFGYESGRRISESCRLLWDDLDAEKKTILVRDLKHPRKKTGHNKRAALPDPAFAIVQRQTRTTTLQDERIFKVLPSTAKAVYRRTCRTLGITGLHLHDSRAALVTRLLDRGYTELQIQLVTLNSVRMISTRYNRLKADDFPRMQA